MTEQSDWSRLGVDIDSLKRLTFQQYCHALEFDYYELFGGLHCREQVLSHFKIAFLKPDQLVPYAYFTLEVPSP